jgi:hypothetical protein
MQVIGRRYADADVLAASAAFERLRPWLDTYQLCANRPLLWRPTDPQEFARSPMPISCRVNA